MSTGNQNQMPAATEGCAAAAGYGRVVERLLPMEWEERTGRTIKVHPRDMTTHQRSTLDTLITLPSYLAFLRRLDLRHTDLAMPTASEGRPQA